MLSHDRVWAAIDGLAERYSMSASGLAKRAGLDSTAFNKSKRYSSDGRPRWPSTESLAKIIEATGASLDEFMGLVESDEHDMRLGAVPTGALPTPRSTVPLLGFAQAGAGGFFDDAGFPQGQGWDLVEMPGQAAEGSYALQVQGSSMLPLYRDGDVLVIRPDATVRSGDRVVVKTREGEVMAKLLERQSARSIELVSLNPEHPNRKILAEDVEWVARIVWASQ
ncbi:helix-turn-helix transcriptional regulator [Mesorhizobium sp. NBSH29]|uniref:S24 family peptidase n=1 Tax=Mesorhizobium sp. NBSH29 TaxID=2654249 RepID=UPI0018965762|nr:helix-turn-helix transcriptional regulator [Mesorhizobium sp. NBSH29]QPC86721.1 helix-turn-helix transcriptional regulator [Mesorhizobium sp. NBSH29]